MDRGLRILVASPLGRIVAPSVAAAFPAWEIDVAEDRESVRRQVIGRVRFDVVIADLVWNNPELEFTFDGLDVIDVLHEANRLAPVILARQGHSMELDLLDEARLRPEVVSVFHKSAGTGELPALIRTPPSGSPTPLRRRPASLRCTSCSGDARDRRQDAWPVPSPRAELPTVPRWPRPPALASTPQPRWRRTIWVRSSGSAASMTRRCR